MPVFDLDGATLVLERPAAGDSTSSIARVGALVLRVAPEDVTVRRFCPTCGASDHGQPVVDTVAIPERSCSVSYSRTGEHSVAAARLGASIGVDIESIARVSRHPVDDVLLHPDERRAVSRLASAAARAYLASLWVAKEALVKSTGDGLRIDPSEILIRIDGTSAEVQSWPSGLDPAAPPRVTLFAVTYDIVGALATQGS